MSMTWDDTIFHLRSVNVWADIPKQTTVIQGYMRALEENGTPWESLKHKVTLRPARDSARVSIQFQVPITDETYQEMAWAGNLQLSHLLEAYFGGMHLDILRDSAGKSFPIPDFPQRDGSRKNKYVTTKTESDSDKIIHTITITFPRPKDQF